MILRFRQDNKGFTLLEIIIALAILTIGLVGVLALFPAGLRASKRAGDFTSATLAAQQVMETIKRAGYNIYTVGWYKPGPGDPPPGYTYSEGIDNGQGIDLPEGFSWAASVANVSGISNLRQVTLSIYWLDRGSYRREDFTTYLANYN